MLKKSKVRVGKKQLAKGSWQNAVGKKQLAECSWQKAVARRQLAMGSIRIAPYIMRTCPPEEEQN
jgi:hypothetical protein